MSDADNASRMDRPTYLQELGRRFSAVLDLFGTRSKASGIAHRSTDQLAKYERGQAEPPFSALARLCLEAGVRLEWLATGEGEMRVTPGVALQQASQPLRREDLMIALQLASEALDGKVLPPDKHAELITLIYELLEEGLPEAKVLRFARAAAA